MIFCVVAVKCLGIMPKDMEDAARVWGQFAIKAWTYACLAGIGFVLIDLETILHTLTPLYLIAVVSIVCAITLTAAVLGKMVGFYPLESAIAAGMCTTNMGGSGNVAVLSSSQRMELLPFAQIVTRSCGALMLTIGGILVQVVG
jgi:Na+/citrate or Na+/malate symporter